MRLLIDYLEEAAGYLREKTERLHKLDEQYHRMIDRDIRREMSLIKKEMRQKRGEVTYELLYNLDEFRYLHKYFPELLKTFMEDEYIGKVISRKAWLLDFKQTPPKEAAAKLEQIQLWRLQLKDAKKFLRKWVGKVSARAFVATYPVLRGHLNKDGDKDEVIEIIHKVNDLLRREGWLLLISDSLIHIPASKFIGKIRTLKMEEQTATVELRKAKGRGTVMETAALRKLEKIQMRKEHYQSVLTQILLANPEYLRAMKKKSDWLSRGAEDHIIRFAKDITPHKVKERAWLNEMNERLAIETDAPEGKPKKRKQKK